MNPKQSDRLKAVRADLENRLIAYRLRAVLEARQADPEAIMYYIQDSADNDNDGFQPKMFSREWALTIWEDFQKYVDECQKAELEYIDHRLLLYAIG